MISRIYAEVGKSLKHAEKEVKAHLPYYVLLTAILTLALFVRVYRTEELLRFYYDQGRDALVIWKLLHDGKPFLIGPITGLKGIYLGPFYYYLIAPLYLIGGGNPVYPAVFLSVLSVLALFVLYYLGWKMRSRAAGIFAATIGAFSYSIFLTSRWLSNPNPILLSSTLLLLSLWKITQGKSKYWWVLASFFVGISLHFESASAVFYLPLMAIFAIWQYKKFPGFKITLLSLLVLFSTFIPQILFNFRHEGLLFTNIKNLFLKERAFRTTTKIIFEERSKYFWSAFSTKIFPSWNLFLTIFVILSGSALIASKYKLKKFILPLFLIFIITPIIGYYLFQGNYNNIYDYYLSGYYLPFVLLFSIGLSLIWKSSMGKIVVVFFFYVYYLMNSVLIKNYIFATPISRPITMEDQLQVVNWVFDDARERGNFNLDVYVPPVIPHAYDYLFLWQANKQCGENLCGMVDDQVDLLYLVIEDDPPYPDRIQAWLDRQKGIAVVEESARFGNITVERRKRF